jgi:hypothetical protein
MSTTREDATAGEASTRSATRFYWWWLIFATGVSVLGNIAHAVLVAPANLWLLAAVASVVPPAFVLGSTHSAALMLDIRRMGWLYVLGLLMTITVAGCAFFLSFHALRDLAVMLGWPPDTAKLFPIAIDVSIAQATFGLLSLGPKVAGVADEQPKPDEGQAAKKPQRSKPTAGRAPNRPPAPTAAHNGASGERRRATQPDAAPARGAAITARPATPIATSARVLTAVAESPAAPSDSPAHIRFKPTAQQLVRSGVTSKDEETVAAILAEADAGTPPSTISRRRGVHHSTVGRILAGAQELTG